jgi:hypothetical protein
LVTFRPQKPSLRAALAPAFAKIGDPAQVERRRRILLEPATIGVEEEDLAAKIVSVLEDGPLTSPEIAKAVTRRHKPVKELLEADARFLRVPPPCGTSRRAKTWGLARRPWAESGRVGTSTSGDVEAAA